VNQRALIDKAFYFPSHSHETFSQYDSKPGPCPLLCRTHGTSRALYAYFTHPTRAFLNYCSAVQNSDDAKAKTVEIHFNTRAFLNGERKARSGRSPGVIVDSEVPSGLPTFPDPSKELLHEWRFRNDGIPFRTEDWSRLKKIGEGNLVGKLRV
jgi:hypothetical protein